MPKIQWFPMSPEAAENDFLQPASCTRVLSAGCAFMRWFEKSLSKPDYIILDVCAGRRLYLWSWVTI